MLIPRFAFLLPIVALAAGCVPAKFLDLAQGAGGAGGESGAGGYGYGGDGKTVSVHTDTMSTGSGGAAGILPSPMTYGYLCGGSRAHCSPDPGSTDCAPGGSGNPGNDTTDGGAKLTCQLVADNGQVDAKCDLAGTAGDGAFCEKATDCQAGFGCAATPPVTGTCRQYCCGDPESCPTQQYCTPGTMAEADIQVPFCQQATMCQLLNEASCPAGQTCSIVRADGTTTCVDVGNGVEGDKCPCAAGYMCSTTTGTCVKLCHVGGQDCGDETCQGGTQPYPPDIGFCH